MAWGAAAVIGGTSLLGSILGANAASDAAGQQANASNNATAAQLQMYNTTRADQAPWRDTGGAAVITLGQLLGLGTPSAGAASTAAPSGGAGSNIVPWSAAGQAPPGSITQAPNGNWQKLVDQGDGNLMWVPTSAPAAANGGTGGAPGGFTAGTFNPNAPLSKTFSIADFWNDPVVQLGYQSGLDLGMKALKNAAPLTTGRDSGAALKELVQFGNDYTGRTMAAGSRDRFVGDQTNLFNRLAGLAGIGQTSANTTASAGMNTATNVGNIATGLGNAQAASTIAGANAWTGGLNSIANFWNQQQMLNRLAPAATPAANPSWGGNSAAYWNQ